MGGKVSRFFILLFRFLCLISLGAAGVLLTLNGCISAIQRPDRSGQEQALSSYFHSKIAKATQNNEKPCVTAARVFLARHTTWKLLSKKCTAGSCDVEVVFKEPVLGSILKRFLREAVVEAMKQRGLGSLNERACRGVAERIKNLSPENLQYRNYRRLLRVKRVNGNWIVDPQN